MVVVRYELEIQRTENRRIENLDTILSDFFRTKVFLDGRIDNLV